MCLTGSASMSLFRAVRRSLVNTHYWGIIRVNIGKNIPETLKRSQTEKSGCCHIGEHKGGYMCEHTLTTDPHRFVGKVLASLKQV